MTRLFTTNSIRRPDHRKGPVVAGDLLLRGYEATPAMLHVIDLEGCILAVSDMWLAKLGYSRAEVLGRNIKEFLTEESLSYSENVVLPAFFASGQCQEIEYKMICKSGDVLSTLISATLRNDDDTVEPCISAAITDITRLRQAEEELGNERKRLSNVIEGTHAATWEWNIQTDELRYNLRWIEILGLRQADLESASGQTWRSLIHPEDLPGYMSLLHRDFRDCSDRFEREIRVRHKEGHWVWVLDCGSVMSQDDQGRAEWICGTRLDIGERKRQEEALRKSEGVLERTGLLAGIGGWEVNLITNEIYWSTETYRIHGVDSSYQPKMEEAIAFYAPEARPAITAAVEKAAAGEGGWDLELPFIRHNGERIWVRAVGSAAFADGKPIRLMGAFQDITARVAERVALERANERGCLATDSGGIGIWEWNVTEDLIAWDPQMFRLFGIEPCNPEEIRQVWREGIHPEDSEEINKTIRACIDGQTTFEFEFRVAWPDGSIHHQRSSGRVMHLDTSPVVRIIGANWDISEAHHASARLAKQHELMRVTLRSIGDAVITTDATGHVTWLNPVAERMTGWANANALGMPSTDVFTILNERTEQRAESPILRCLSEREIVGLEISTILISRDGTRFGIEDSAAPIIGAHKELLGAVLVFHDVTEQRRMAKEITHRAAHDLLTGLPNRSEFEVRPKALLDREDEEGSQGALLFIDLDQFKIVNDSCGHAVGDQLLCQVSRVFMDVIRVNDTLARIGGDEFAIILEQCPLPQAQVLAQRICDRMEEFRFLYEDRRFRIGASIGLVPIDERWKTTASIFHAADTCCYAAKEAGRNRVHVWLDSDEVVAARTGESRWATRLEQALDEDQFKLFAQRYVSLSEGGEGVCAEVLLRMVDADGGLIQPGAFLPAAERFHLASRVDRWVLTEVLRWMDSNAPLHTVECLNVNLSGQSVGDRAFHRWAKDRLSRLEPELRRKLCLEITETAAVTNFADAVLFIEEMRALKVRVALDDFGAGASWFGYLKKMPVDFLKIDGQFVRDLTTNPLNEAVVQCFSAVARTLNLKIVAEFVEDQDVMDKLMSMGVTFAQGFFVHRPAPISELL